MAAEIRIEIDGIDALQRRLRDAPKQIQAARRRAFGKLATWVRRQVARAVSQEANIPQKVFLASKRTATHIAADGGELVVWVGTRDLPAHRIGTVRWTRRMTGARAGRRLFPGTWSWGPGSKTGSAIFRRLGPERTPIARETIPIHAAAQRGLDNALPEISARFLRLLRAELRYELLKQQAAA